MDKGEDVTVIPAQQLPQVRTARGMALIALGFTHGPGGLECLGDLVIQFNPVGHDHESPVARHLAQHLLGEEHHRKTFPAALRLPKYAAATVALLTRLQHRGDGVVYAEKLVILADDLHQPGLVLREQREILHQVEQPGPVASAA